MAFCLINGVNFPTPEDEFTEEEPIRLGGSVERNIIGGALSTIPEVSKQVFTLGTHDKLTKAEFDAIRASFTDCQPATITGRIVEDVATQMIVIYKGSTRKWKGLDLYYKMRIRLEEV
jgi:hypothetical protein